MLRKRSEKSEQRFSCQQEKKQWIKWAKKLLSNFQLLTKTLLFSFYFFKSLNQRIGNQQPKKNNAQSTKHQEVWEAI